MAHYDDDTQKFMEDVSSEKVLKKAINVADAFAKKKAIGPMLGKELVKAFVKQSSVAAIKLYEDLNTRFGKLWWDWESETLWHTLEGVYDLTDEFKNLVQALQTLTQTKYPFEHWHIFEKVGHALTGNHVDFENLQPLEPNDAAIACKLMRQIQPKQEFDTEVLGYIAACAHHAGMVYLPEDLFPKGSQTYLDQLTFDHALRDRVIRGIHGDAEDVQLAKLEEIRLGLH